MTDQRSDQVDRTEERRLIRKARAGDTAALRALVDGHKDRLFSFIFRMVRNHHDAEEICQDAFLKAFSSLDSYSTQYRFSTWLFTIGYRICLNNLRRKKALTGEASAHSIESQVTSDGQSPLESEDAARLRDRIWEAVDRLAPAQRASVLLFYRQEQSCQDIAKVLQVPVATVKSHLHRARARLRDALEPIAGTELGEWCNQAG